MKFSIPSAKSLSYRVQMEKKLIGIYRRRFWRLEIKTNFGADWGVGFNRIRFFSRYGELHHGEVKKEIIDVCNQYKTCGDCVFKSLGDVSDEAQADGAAICGWCPSSSTCKQGKPTKNAKLTSAHDSCSVGWQWTSCAPGKYRVTLT